MDFKNPDPKLVEKIKAIREQSDAAVAARMAEEAARLQPERLEELSKKTLGRYINKASTDAKHKGYTAGYDDGGEMATVKDLDKIKGPGQADDNKAYKRLKGVRNAVDRLVYGGYTKEEAEALVAKAEALGLSEEELMEGKLLSKFSKPAPDAAKIRKAKAAEAAKDKAERDDIQKATDEMGRGKKNEEVELVDEGKSEKKKDFDDRQERIAAAVKQMDPAKLERMKKIPGFSAAMDLAKKTVKEEALNEVKDHEIHVTPHKDGGYVVKAVGKKFAEGVKVGERLTDTHLDDASEMGAKIKMKEEVEMTEQDMMDLAAYIAEEMAFVEEVLEEGKNSVTPVTSYKYKTRTYSDKSMLAHAMAKDWEERRAFDHHGEKPNPFRHSFRKSGKMAKAYEKANDGSGSDKKINNAMKIGDAFHAKAHRRIMKVLTKNEELQMSEEEVDLLFAEGLDTSGIKVFENEVELNWLDEMAKRGRPRKNPRPEGEEDAGPEADHHIIMQLRKAENMDDKGGKKEVEFKDGKKHIVPSHVAKTILGFHEKLKPESKSHLQDMIGKSHKHLMDVHAALTAQNKK
jgi:hypothetical protein